MDCLLGSRQMCGEAQLEEMIRNSNSEMFSTSRRLTWHHWMTRVGKSAPEKCQIRGTVSPAVNELVDLLKDLKAHVFRANWNKNIFDFVRKNLSSGYLVQIFDFAQNFKNIY